MTYYQQTTEEVFNELKTSALGLSSEEANLRLSKNGPNVLEKVKKTSLLIRFLNQFKDVLIWILIFAAILALIVGEPRDAIIIFIIILINSIIGLIQEYKAEKILSAFSEHLPAYAKVMRNKRIERILTSRLVVGDVIRVEAGDRVPADCRIIKSFSLKTNEMTLTGESIPQDKNNFNIDNDQLVGDQDNMIFMGTNIEEGEAEAVVVACGMQTEFGKIAEQSQKVKENLTPLQKELIHIGNTTIKIALVIVVSTLIIFDAVGKEWRDSILFAIAASVAVVPEGLPAATSIALSLGASRMLKKKALVKKLLHVESLGSVTVICTDKTGTITEGKMKVKKTSITDRQQFLQALALCNNASISDPDLGDPLEYSLLEYTKDQSVDIAKLTGSGLKIFEIPFSSQTKMMTSVWQFDQKIYSYTKGAPLEIINLSSLSQKDKDKYLKLNDRYSEQGLRVLAVAYRQLENRDQVKEKYLLKDLSFLGLIALYDPPREGVKEAVALCKKAKIRVIMITGDYGKTAKAIADQIGLSTPKTQVITGEELHAMDDEKLKKFLTKDVLFARTDPGQKLRIVKNLQELDEVVAVTGDGVNDAPALVKADIGVAMGKIGTDVAKEAADMILLDDHFSTIVNAVWEGRRIYENVKKFVFYVFSSNSGELFVSLIGILAGLPAPLLAVQILAIDLGTDVFPSLALGLENAEPGIMSRPPRSKHEKVMTSSMLIRLLFIGLSMAILALAVFLITLYSGGWQWGQALKLSNKLYLGALGSVYATLAFCQAANAFSCRSEKASLLRIGLFSNRWLIISETLSAMILFSILLFPPLQKVFYTIMPSLSIWPVIIISFIVFLLFVEGYKKWQNKLIT